MVYLISPGYGVLDISYLGLIEVLLRDSESTNSFDWGDIGAGVRIGTRGRLRKYIPRNFSKG